MKNVRPIEASIIKLKITIRGAKNLELLIKGS